ncbi:MAG TPA: ABC transporter ATP-binding protein [Casimicrobiaceae bacterium]|nr:ABC transporter ATP-binding protein [Casimicrobiaceae bacterium]
MATVETRALTRRFAAHTAVDRIDLAVREGEFLVLVGPSGCGKTTLLRMLAGLERPSSGDVLIGGRVVTAETPRERNIAMVFQSYALYPHLTVARNIAFPLRAARVASGELRERVARAADMFGIRSLLGRKPRQLSGGERQRVALARAVVREPVAFLLDEPLSNLDAKLRASARDELQRFQRRLGTTTIYVTHDQVEAMGLGDRIAVLSGGRLLQIGRPVDIYEWPQSTFVATFMGSPPMNLVPVADGWLGMRPEHLLPAEIYGGHGDLVAATLIVHRVENLGADRLVYATLEPPHAPADVIARLPSIVAVTVAPGETRRFAIRRRDLRHFDTAGRARQ